MNSSPPSSILTSTSTIFPLISQIWQRSTIRSVFSVKVRHRRNMDGVGDGTIKLGTLSTRPDRRFNLDPPEVSVSSPVTRQKAAAAKQFIENHYKNYLQGLQDRKERRREMQRKAQEAKVSSEEEEEMMRELERKETELMRLQSTKWELMTLSN
ncbi:unnamed protein product [Camellia sinensis]